MSKEDNYMEVQGIVVETLPNAQFKVKITGPATLPEQFIGKIVLAHIAGKMKMHFIRILEGDTVTMDLSLYDYNRARITFRNK